MRKRDLRHLRRVAAAADWGDFDAKSEDDGDDDSPDDDHDGYQPIRERANNGLCGVDGRERKEN